ncbi:tetrapyrrole biosynthesis, uroporphyrinogen III synthase [Irpex rosettiformis]|uniref:Tetrapyrrole biosynthesis, uroporphyrinogen III synthase n=1 Tax=Irpex rosettiformis TaxID=378272 RepID=A0ACB8UDN4_9APHY|nr:tetrapyrrole biosynthesis, uroporphyrinogen III synthase [Irpex rosettiformis]
MDNVLLLRSPNIDGPDKYESALRAAGYYPLSVPVLETVLVNGESLHDIVQKDPKELELSGVVITSSRSCEAWRETVQSFVAESPTADWSTLPFYVVGQATATSLEEINKVAGKTMLAPRNILGGSETGTGEKLAHFILEDLKPHTPALEHPVKLLYLTGDKNRDVLPNILRGGGIDLQPLQVYQTQGASTFPQDLDDAMNAVPDKSRCWWIVYFAPSAADFVTPVLRNRFEIPDPNSQLFATKIAAIGPTTSIFLRDELHLRVDVLSPKPNPESLALSIHNFDSRPDMF